MGRIKYFQRTPYKVDYQYNKIIDESKGDTLLCEACKNTKKFTIKTIARYTVKMDGSIHPLNIENVKKFIKMHFFKYAQYWGMLAYEEPSYAMEEINDGIVENDDTLEFDLDIYGGILSCTQCGNPISWMSDIQNEHYAMNCPGCSICQCINAEKPGAMAFCNYNCGEEAVQESCDICSHQILQKEYKYNAEDVVEYSKNNVRIDNVEDWIEADSWYRNMAEKEEGQ